MYSIRLRRGQEMLSHQCLTSKSTTRTKDSPKLYKRWDLASDEQKARIAQIKAQTDKLKGTDNEEELSRLDQVLSEIKGVV